MTCKPHRLQMSSDGKRTSIGLPTRRSPTSCREMRSSATGSTPRGPWRPPRAMSLTGRGRYAATAVAETQMRELDRRARHRAVRAEHAAIAAFRAQQGVAALALVEKPARIRRHRLDLAVTTMRAGDLGTKFWLRLLFVGQTHDVGTRKLRRRQGPSSALRSDNPRPLRIAAPICHRTATRLCSRRVVRPREQGRA